MKISVLGSGPTDPVLREGKSKRLQSSILIDDKVLVDATPSIEKQLKKKELSFILITHAHRDAYRGLDYIDSWGESIEVLSLPHTIALIKDRLSIKNLILKPVEANKSFDFKGYSLMPVAVEHSIQAGFDPVAAWVINNLVYCEDVDYKFFFSNKADFLKEQIKKADLTILDGAMCSGRIRGHLNLFEAASKLKEARIKNIMFTQIGRSCPNHDVLLKQVKQIHSTFDVAYDGRIFNVTHTENLIENKEGIYLTEPHAKMIWQGNKTLIIKSREFGDAIGKVLYLIGGNNCYGLIKIKKIDLIDLDEFKKLEEQHRITDAERQKWWNGKQKLFAYEFETIEKFSNPKLVEVPKGMQTFIKDVQFLTELQDRTEYLIKNIKEYDPQNIELPQLRDDFRIALAWYCSKKAGKPIKHSIEDVENTLQLIVQELIKRGNTAFHPEQMKPCAKEAFEKVMDRIKTKTFNEVKKEQLSDTPEFCKYFEDATLIKDGVSLIGSSIETSNYHDIDVLIRMQKPSDYLRRAVETRLIKMMPPEFADKLHFVWGDSEGPHDKFIPLYDIMLKRLDPKVINMSERGGIKLMEPFIPMKPKRRFYQMEEAVSYMFGG